MANWPLCAPEPPHDHHPNLRVLRCDVCVGSNYGDGVMAAKNSKPIHTYKIGDLLYRYVGMTGVFKYVVTGVRTYEGETQLEVECQTCSHGYKCRLLLARDDYGRIIHVHLLNDDEDDSQRMWHTNDGFYFVETVSEAKKQGIAKMMEWNEKRVRECEDALESAKKRRAELKGLFDGVQP